MIILRAKFFNKAEKLRHASAAIDVNEALLAGLPDEKVKAITSSTIAKPDSYFIKTSSANKPDAVKVSKSTEKLLDEAKKNLGKTTTGIALANVSLRYETVKRKKKEKGLNKGKNSKQLKIPFPEQ